MRSDSQLTTSKGLESAICRKTLPIILHDRSERETENMVLLEQMRESRGS